MEVVEVGEALFLLSETGDCTLKGIELSAAAELRTPCASGPLPSLIARLLRSEPRCRGIRSAGSGPGIIDDPVGVFQTSTEQVLDLLPCSSKRAR